MAQLKAHDTKMLTLFLTLLVFGFLVWCFLIDISPSTLFKFKIPAMSPNGSLKLLLHTGDYTGYLMCLKTPFLHFNMRRKSALALSSTRTSPRTVWLSFITTKT